MSSSVKWVSEKHSFTKNAFEAQEISPLLALYQLFFMQYFARLDSVSTSVHSLLRHDTATFQASLQPLH